MYKSLFISDTHLGSFNNNSKKLFDLLENIEAEQLFLLGDIINKSAGGEHPDIIKFITLIQNKKWEIIYISGNNEDERIKLPAVSLSFTKEFFSKKNYIYKNSNHLVYLEHGHNFHYQSKVNIVLRKGLISFRLFLSYLKKRGKDSSLNETNNVEKESFYHRYFKPLAQKILRHSFKLYMTTLAKENSCSTVICGHIHISEDKMVRGVRYLNCGDWVKNSTYVVENKVGEFFLIDEK